MRADEQLGPDLGVRLSLGGEPGDLLFLGRELVARLGRPDPRVLTGGEKLDLRAVRESARADRFEHLMGGPQLYARVAAPAQPTQPLAEEQLRARQLGRDAGVAEVVERFAIEALGCIVGREQRIRAREQAERPRRASRESALAEAL